MDIRPSSIAGSWYPGDPQELTSTIQGFLAQGKTPPPEGRVWGLLAPHAGYRYSGAVAGQAFACVRGQQFDLVAVIAPYHAYPPAPVLTTAHQAYETPLGLVPVDASMVAAFDRGVLSRLGQRPYRLRNDHEHAVEIELPFLQHGVGAFRFLPVMMGLQTQPVARAVGEALAEVCAAQRAQGGRALLVASSDLSHFYPENLARQFDAEMLRRVAAFDPGAVLQAEEQGVGFACGRGAIAAVLWAAHRLGANRVRVAGYATSGEATGEKAEVVGYGAAVVWEEARRGPDDT